jgi:hypothetical protein
VIALDLIPVAVLAAAAWPARRLAAHHPGARARARRDDTAMAGPVWLPATPQDPGTGRPLYLPEVAHEWTPMPGVPVAEEIMRNIRGPEELTLPAIDAEVAGKVAAGVRADLAEVAPDDDDLWEDVPEDGTVHMYQLADGQIVPADSYVPEPDDLAVATPEQEADAFVGDLGPAEPPAMLTDFREETGTWPKLVAEVAAEAGQP